MLVRLLLNSGSSKLRSPHFSSQSTSYMRAVIWALFVFWGSVFEFCCPNLPPERRTRTLTRLSFRKSLGATPRSVTRERAHMPHRVLSSVCRSGVPIFSNRWHPILGSFSGVSRPFWGRLGRGGPVVGRSPNKRETHMYDDAGALVRHCNPFSRGVPKSLYYKSLWVCRAALRF